jgi:hypothetical protein
MECLGLHNKPKAEMQPRHKLTGPKEEEEEGEEYLQIFHRTCKQKTISKTSV